MFDGDEGLLNEFVVEANEGLAEIESDLLAIEAGGADIDADLVNKVFRAIHTIKGASGFLALTRIGELTHSMENVLSLVRNRSLAPSTPMCDQLLKSADLLRRMIAEVERSNEFDVGEHCAKLKAIAEGQPLPVADVAGDVEPTDCVEQPELVVAAKSGSRYEVAPATIAQCRASGQNVFELEFDLLHDREAANPVDCLQRLKDTGTVLDSYLDAGDDASQPGDPIDTSEPTTLNWKILHATVLDEDQAGRFFGVPKNRIRAWVDAPHSSSARPHTVDAPRPVEPAPPVENPAPATPAAPHSFDASHASAGPSTNKEPARTQDDADAPARKVSGAADANIRVSVAVLDRLMNLAGELVLGRNQLLQTVGHADRRTLDSVVGRIDQVTSDLQETIMQTRMQPIGTVFSKFTRVVRDLGQTLGKQCQLEIEGKDVELDKTIIESIGDPLTHLVRNSMDHGLEKPDVRKQAGKNPMGTIRLRAVHQEGKVLLSITDDGAGIDASKIRRKAVEKGVITAEAAETMSDRDAVQLIFAPGFSTAEQVTAVSGRGVGMDVVKTNFERLGGTVEIDTVVGQGTTITVRLPLTLAIIPSLITTCGGQRFAVPQVSISELVRVQAHERDQKISLVNRSEVLRLRGSLLPLVRLGRLIGRDENGAAPSEADESSNAARNTNIVVVEIGRLRYGLVVDRLHDSEEIVVKPLGRHFKNVNFLAGATVLGDGSVAMILDAGGIASRAGLHAGEQSAFGAKALETGAAAGETMATLLFTNHPKEWFGVPMSVVARIERIRVEQIDSVAGQDVLQYRGGTLPLLSLERCIHTLPREEQERLYVLVFKHGGRELGLIVPTVYDIRHVPTEMDTLTFQEKGVLGSAVIEGRTVRFLDVYDLGNTRHAAGRAAQTGVTLTGAASHSGHDSAEDFATRSHGEPADHGATRTILYAEDSTFFRKKVVRFLQEEGWTVIACEDGHDAWEKLADADTHVDLVVTDVEMPRVNGFELCERIRRSDRWRDVPVVAVTSLASDADRERGAKAGVSEYLVKMDRDQLLETVSRHLGLARV